VVRDRINPALAAGNCGAAIFLGYEFAERHPISVLGAGDGGLASPGQDEAGEENVTQRSDYYH